ncbi:MAG: hypothetical protein KJO08_07360 [Gammaproteobacteria bacterium]|nr:hypothetical protein [Gammaproteobacteria bacterium]NNJ85229.1 hypothetical protein [Gammaproteobacteria bacterium]
MLSSGVDGKIYRLGLPDGRHIHSFELKLRCREMKVADLKGEREKRILEKAGAIGQQ